ncbi:cobalt-precorrin-5B (C(1))-methyltransferase CbiD [Labilibacter marinus]|uniref:cobalt-precorrin-5B (C(1))-methyltransferase CbiD n=1 Tax=Labilibacter marinus TaxID=1477105 RepID=UPI00094FFF26|nr:cobalt-precorrin-5B (C(1))-methyltransferase CbiD [Labilibacter marinus]
MILVFGGTTEGKKVASLLDWLKEDYIYSTRTPVKYKVGGEQINGELTFEKTASFCVEQEVKVIVDAAHPFAVNVHDNIKQVSLKLDIPILRYSRVFPSYEDEKLVRLFDSYEQMVSAIEAHKSFKIILALTGVQTINHFKSLWDKRDIYFRILDTELSRSKAIETGVDMARVLPEDPKADASVLMDTCKKVGTQLLLSKESGESGLMDAKLQAAKQFNIPLWVVKRPQLPEFDFEVFSDKELLQHIYRLRKTILKKGEDLQSGFTTGVCVAACVKSCLKALQTRRFSKEESVLLESGDKADFIIYDGKLGKNEASCLVIKNSGDDPDVTHAEEIGCSIRLNNSGKTTFKAGEGVGIVTMPGLQVKVGEPAINPGPRKLIEAQIDSIKKEVNINCGVEISPFVPKGRELAKQTFNPRIGIEGGISILGTTGVLRPFSSEAYVNSIRQYISVAINNQCRRIFLTPGKRSEGFMKAVFSDDLQYAFIHIGNFIGESLEIVAQEKVDEVVLGIMLGKAIKLAEGNLDTHSSKVVFNAEFACNIATRLNYPSEKVNKIKQAKLANEIWEHIPYAKEERFYMEVVRLAKTQCVKVSEVGQSIKFVLFTPKGESIML